MSPETSLLKAVRDRLQLAEADGGAGLAARDCEVELDEFMPATSGHKYVAVTPGGVSFGADHDPANGILEIVWSIDVHCMIRVANVARDRVRNPFALHNGSLESLCWSVVNAMGTGYEVTNAVNIALAADGDSGGFEEPPVFVSMDPKPRLLENLSTDKPQAAVFLARRLTFGRAVYRRKPA